MRRTRVLTLLGLMLGLMSTDLRAGQLTEVVAFGDSLTDTGNLFLATRSTFPPSPPYFNGHFSNGPVWVEALATGLGLPAPTPSLAGGTDYAWGGAETGQSGASQRGTPNIGAQINSYLTAHPVVTEHQLIALWGGANDFLYAGQKDPTVPVANLAAEITTLARAGAVNFLIPNLPPLGETPRYVGTSNEAPFNALTVAFNSDLDATLNRLANSLGINIHEFDSYDLSWQILRNPASLGLTNVTGTALNVPGGGVGNGTVVPNPDQYFFWDDLHPTRVTHQVLGQSAAAVVAAAEAVAPEPSSLESVIAAGLCLLGFGWYRRKRSAA